MRNRFLTVVFDFQAMTSQEAKALNEQISVFRKSKKVVAEALGDRLKTCQWSKGDGKAGEFAYQMECGNTMALTDEIDMLGLQYCPYCGGGIEQA